MESCKVLKKEREAEASRAAPKSGGSSKASTSKAKDPKKLSDDALLMPTSGGSPSDRTRSKRAVVEDDEIFIYDVKRSKTIDKYLISQAQRDVMLKNLARSIYINNHPYRMVECPYLQASYGVVDVALPGRGVSNMFLF